jgi:transposase
MYFYYQFRRDEFLRHYHKRSNVESTFSAVKRKFGDAVRSKTPVAMVNECLCKFVAHNLRCVILSQIELGIDATFWADKDDGPRDVLPMTRRG